MSFPSDRHHWAYSNVNAPRLHVVLEDGHKNAEDAVRIYKWVQNRIGQSRALAGLSFNNKMTCLPLAAADLFAYTAWGAEVGQKPIGTPKKPMKSEASYRRNYFRIELNRDSLDSLHEQAIMLADPGSFLSQIVPGRQPS